MKTENIIIANLKCNGCATTIMNELKKITGVKTVAVDFDDNSVEITTLSNVKRNQLIEKLLSLGYPEATEKNGLMLKLKSLSSCMVGRIDNMANA